MITQELTVSPTGIGAPTKFYAVQGESGARELQLDLLDAQGIPANIGAYSRAFLFVIKPDHHVSVLECEIGSSGKPNQVSCVLTLQACACAGQCSLLLIVLTQEGELRYDNMVLDVEPSHVEGIASLTELGPLGKMLNSAQTIQTLLESAQFSAESAQFSAGSAASALREVLDKYVDAFRKIAGESFRYTENPGFMPALDKDGHALLVASNPWNGEGSLFSTDEGAAWHSTQYNEGGSTAIGCNVVVGGKKFLVAWKNTLVWGEIHGNNVLWEDQVTGPASWAAKSSHGVTSGKYLNGKYFLCYACRGDWGNPPVGRNLFCFDESGASTEVRLPNDRMAATCLAYDSANNRYLVAGRYAYALQSDSRDHQSWILASSDLQNWTTVYEDTDGHDYEFKEIHVLNGRVIAILNEGITGYMRIVAGEANSILTSTMKMEYVPLSDKTQCFHYSCSAACLAGLAVDGSPEMLYTRDGTTFETLPRPFAEQEGAIYEYAAAQGRHILFSYGDEYALFRVDLYGENLKEELQKAENDYIEAANFVLETTKSNTESINTLNTLFTEHKDSPTLHLTEQEKTYLGMPFSLLHYVGTGKTELTRYYTVPLEAAIIMCSDHGPSEIDSNGVEHVYWDFWGEKTYGDMVNGGGGGIGYVNNYLTSYSKTIGNRVFHLNDKGLRYFGIMLIKRPTK